MNTHDSTTSESPRKSSKPLTLTPETVTKGLGWFSIALGAVELFAPQATKEATGVRHGKNLLQASGAREIATGIGLLTAKDPQPWLWGRVVGDAMDLATLAADLATNKDKRRNTALSFLAVLGVTALDVWAAQSARRAAQASLQPPRDDTPVVGTLPAPPDGLRGKAVADLHLPNPQRPDTLH